MATRETMKGASIGNKEASLIRHGAIIIPLGAAGGSRPLRSHPGCVCMWVARVLAPQLCHTVFCPIVYFAFDVVVWLGKSARCRRACFVRRVHSQSQTSRLFVSSAPLFFNPAAFKLNTGC